MKQASERDLLHHGDSPGQWGNLGLWPASSYALAAQALADAVLRAARVRRGQRLVMCGCGAGAELWHALHHHGLNAAVGIEQDPALAELARASFNEEARRPPSMAQVLTGDACQLDMPLRQAGLAAAETWDALVAIDAAYHFSPRNSWLRAGWHALKPGGRIAYTDLVVPGLSKGRGTPLDRPWRALSGMATGIDATDLVSADAAQQRLANAGFVEITHVDLGAAVLDGFADFVRERSVTLARDMGWPFAAPWLLAARLSGWRRVAATAGLIQVGRRQGLSYGLFSARKPES